MIQKSNQAIRTCTQLREHPNVYICTQNVCTSYSTHLSQAALNLPEEVIVTQGDGGIVQIIDGELQLLRLLKSILKLDCFGKLWTLVVLDQLSACILERKEEFIKLHSSWRSKNKCMHD